MLIKVRKRLTENVETIHHSVRNQSGLQGDTRADRPLQYSEGFYKTTDLLVNRNIE